MKKGTYVLSKTIILKKGDKFEDAVLAGIQDGSIKKVD